MITNCFLICFSRAQEAEISIRFFRGVELGEDDEHMSTRVEEVKMEFSSIKSLISERASGGTGIELKDFCMLARNSIE